MSIFNKIFGSKKEAPRADNTRTKEDKTYELQRAEAMAEGACWQAAVWWIAKVLEQQPDSLSARELFVKALANALAGGLVTYQSTLEKKHPMVVNLLDKGNLNLDEAKSVADALIAGYYLDLLVTEFEHLNERLESGQIKSEASLLKSDVQSAIDAALDFGDVTMPGQKLSIHWKSLLSPESNLDIEAFIELQRQVLVILLRVDSPSNWTSACREIASLLRSRPTEQGLANEFDKMAGEKLGFEKFQELKNKFISIFAKNGACIIQMRNRAREPV